MLYLNRITNSFIVLISFNTFLVDVVVVFVVVVVDAVVVWDLSTAESIIYHIHRLVSFFIVAFLHLVEIS